MVQMDNQLWLKYKSVQEELELRALHVPMWPYEGFSMKEDNFFESHLMQVDFQDDNVWFWYAMIMEASMISHRDARIKQQNTNSESTVSTARAREKRVLTLEEVSQYFYMPIVQAAKELNVGLTLLKRKCRELGIRRWPHRKMKSMQTLIKNVLELGWVEGSVGDTVKRSIEKLEEEKKSMEMEPWVKMEIQTKRLRQACFKANHKKRRLVGDGELKREI